MSDQEQEAEASDSTGEESVVVTESDEETQVVDVDERSEVIPYVYTITSFGADFLVDGLVQRMIDGDIVIPTFDPEVSGTSGVVGFQRGSVWTRPQMDKFIESLLLGLPVPGIFLVSEPDDKLLVLDGQQRLRTLRDFVSGMTRGREFKLINVQHQFKGRSYSDLDDEDRRRLRNSIIHATIVRQDSPSDDQSSIYMIFERLNSGGTALQPQEIRVALYGGPFVDLLRELNALPAWRTLYGPPSKRMKDLELILRFFAMLERGLEHYFRPMTEFLNRYMGAHRALVEDEKQNLYQTFVQTADVILEGVGAKAFRLAGDRVNAALLDSLMVGVALRLKDGPIADLSSLREAYEALTDTEAYLAVIQRSTANEESVKTRLTLARDAFAAVL